MSTSEKRALKPAIPRKRPLFYYITDRKSLAGKSLDSCIRRALAWGIDFIQIREKDMTDQALYKLTCRVMSLARGSTCRILVNGRADIALAAGAHGVHLPSSGLRVTDIRSWLPRDFVFGVSAHSLREARDACKQGAGYVLLGPVFATESKLQYGPPLGLSYLQKVCSKVTVPVFGLGGVHAESVDKVLKSGAAGVAGISLFQSDAHFKTLTNNFNDSNNLNY